MPALLILGVLTACESTGRTVSSTTSEEATPETIIAPIVEDEEVFEPVVEAPEAAPPLVEPDELAVELQDEITQEQTKPIREQSSTNIKKATPRPTPPPKKQPSLAMPQLSTPPKPQKILPSEPVKPKRLQDIYFDFDQATILNPAKPVLEANAALLQTRFKNRNVLIEGHCDERGSVEYNLVLGVRRAQVVKAYLMDLGISQSRIRIVSFGKERPVCTQQNDSCWQKNRRTHFVIQ